MARLVPSLFALACLAFLTTAFSTPAKAVNLVTNGSFETTSSISSPGGYFCSNATPGSCVSNVSGWSSVCASGGCGSSSSPDSILYNGTNGSGFNGGIGLQGTVPNTPDGSKYAALDADTQFNAVIYQQISGLTVGGKYALTFYQAGAQQKGATGSFTEQLNVYFAAAAPTTLSAASATLHGNSISVSGGAPTAWTLQTLILTATSATEYLGFLATSSSQVPPVALLDAVSLTATPEPSTFVLALASLGGLGVYMKRRRSTRS